MKKKVLQTWCRNSMLFALVSGSDADLHHEKNVKKQMKPNETGL
jgi:hypothetical protein